MSSSLDCAAQEDEQLFRALKKSFRKAKLDRETSRARIVALQNRIETIVDEVDTLKASNTAVNQELSVKQNEVDVLKREKATLKNHNTRLKIEKGELEYEKENEISQKNWLRRTIRETDEENSTLKAQNREMKEKIREYEAALGMVDNRRPR